MVQFGNVNRSTVKVFGYLFGQQAPLLATGLLPFWFIEGDAVMAETQMSSFGRGLQPSFTMHYRALGDEILRSRNPDKWFCGSYKDYVPSHYELGFQLVSYADRRYDEYIGASITRYTSDYPILIFTTQARAEQILRHLHAAGSSGRPFPPSTNCGTRCPTRATVRAWYRRR